MNVKSSMPAGWRALHVRRIFVAAMAALGALLAQALASACHAQGTAAASDPDSCGEVVALDTGRGSTQRYAFAPPRPGPAQGEPYALVLLPGGSGFVNLDAAGCPRALKGNSLVRSIPLFRAAGFFTALVDAPSDHHGEDGLGGFRVETQHAGDLGRLVADVRARARAPVWIVGTSRGAISAVNAAARLAGDAAPAGLVLTSPLMSGQPGARKFWVAHSVFDLPLESIRVPVLVVGHAADTCVRSPASRMGEITARTNGAREQVVVVTGGPGGAGSGGIAACEGRSPHGFLDQEAEVVEGMARFVRGGRY